MAIDKFPEEVIDKLLFYVYRLIDPRNGQTFYVGKGTGNRIFAHVNGVTEEDQINEKMNLIREIRLDGFEVQHVIHRHGMDSNTAFEVEAALIDCYAGLSNIAGGHNNEERGSMHAKQIMTLYAAEEMRIEDNLILININQSSSNLDVYEAVRFAWRLDIKKAKQIKYVLAIVRGMVKDVFEVEEWLEATPTNFPGKPHCENRYGFIGKEAQQDITNKYLNKRVPTNLRHIQNPVRYVYKDSATL